MASSLSNCSIIRLAWTREALGSIDHVGGIKFEVNKLALFVGNYTITTNILGLKAIRKGGIPKPNLEERSLFLIKE